MMVHAYNTNTWESREGCQPRQQKKFEISLNYIVRLSKKYILNTQNYYTNKCHYTSMQKEIE